MPVLVTSQEENPTQLQTPIWQILSDGHGSGNNQVSKEKPENPRKPVKQQVSPGKDGDQEALPEATSV